MSHKGLLIFDFDNTLVDTRGVGIHALDQVESFLRTMDGADRLLENKSRLFQTFERNLRERGEDKSGRVDIETWRSGLWREAAISAGVGDLINDPASAEINAVWKSSRLDRLKIPDAVAEMLVQLRKEYDLCLLTNGNSIVQSEKIQRTGAAAFFDLVVISGDHPWEKPDVEIYNYLAGKMNLDSLGDAVMIGDNWDTDIRGGLNAGVKAVVWIRRPDIGTTEDDEEKLNSYSGLCHKTTDVLALPTLLNQIYILKQ